MNFAIFFGFFDLVEICELSEEVLGLSDLPVQKFVESRSPMRF